MEVKLKVSAEKYSSQRTGQVVLSAQAFVLLSHSNFSKKLRWGKKVIFTDTNSWDLLLYWMLSHVCCYSFLGLLSWLFIGDWWCWCHHKCLVSVQRTEGKAGQESEMEAKLTTSTPLQDQQEAEGVCAKPLVFMYGSLWMPILKQKYLIK